jgi:OFA family oxalate/formate antiporter-like MFS transporter
MSDRNGGSGSGLGFSRWWLVVAGVLVMGAAGTYQFVWSSVRGAVGAQVGAGEATLGTLFTLLIAGQTLAQFPAGWVRDRYGPRLPLVAGAVLLAAGYAGLAVAGSPLGAGLAVVAGGCGAGVAYTVAVNTPVKWFDRRRGLATGLVTMAYGGFSVLLIPAVQTGALGGVVRTLLALAAVVGVAGAVGVAVLRDPRPGNATGGDDAPSGEQADGGAPGEPPGYGWREAARTWQFWALYAAFAVINGVGLMLIGTSVAFAEALGFPTAAATATASVVALADSGGVLAGGLAADRIGETRTVGGSLLLSGAGVAGAVALGGTGATLAFVAVVGTAAFFRSPVFAAFPSLVARYYGRARSSENYAALYSAKVPGAVFGGTVTSLLIARLGWERSFLLGALLLGLAGLLVLAVRPVESG